MISPEAIEAEISDRFRLPAPTFLSVVGKSAPIMFSHLRCDEPDHEKSKHVRPEDGYVVHIMLRKLADARVWLSGREFNISGAPKGGVVMGHLESDPCAAFHAPFDIVRFQVSKATLDELADESCAPRPDGLRRPEPGVTDPVMYHLAAAVAPLLDQGTAADQLLLDHVALAFHAHLVAVYGGSPLDGRSAQGGLAPWQERKAKAFMDANLNRGVTLSEIAVQCGLSPSHFSRAFRNSTGRPPHRWMLERRIELAKARLTEPAATLTQVAAECGFSDASHFSRVFSKLAGETPAAWRRTARS